MKARYENLLKKAKHYLAVSAWKPDKIFTKAEDVKIWLNDKPYFDFACGPGVANVGYNHPEILETLHSVYSNKEAGYGGNMLVNKYQIELAEKLCEITPGKFPKKVFFSNSGGEAVEAAIIACLRSRPERQGMVSFIGDFHGRIGYSRTATTSKPLHIEGWPRGISKAFFLIFPAENPENSRKILLDNLRGSHEYLNYVDSTIGPFINEINFAILELIQGEGGINIANKLMIKDLVRYLLEHKITVIVDEVQTGLGRTGKMWASELYDIEPDIITVAKALSGGVVPIGATIMREELSYSKTGEHCNTFGGSAPACAVGLKVLEIIQREKLVEHSESAGEFLRDYLGSRTLISAVSGCGLMNRITFDSSELRVKVLGKALDSGFYSMAAGEKSIRLMPPLTITRGDIKEALDILVDKAIMA